MTRLLAALALAAVLVGGARAADIGGISGLVTVNPLQATLTLAAPSVAVGSEVAASAVVTNLGGVDVGPVAVELRLDPAGLAVGDGTIRTIDLVSGGGSETVTWTICGLAVGNYIVLASARSAQFEIDSPAQILSVTSATGSCAAQQLRDEIVELDLGRRVERSLLAKVDAVLASAARGEVRAACGQLRALQNQIRAQSGTAIEPGDAAALAALVRQAQRDLGC